MLSWRPIGHLESSAWGCLSEHQPEGGESAHGCFSLVCNATETYEIQLPGVNEKQGLCNESYEWITISEGESAISVRCAPFAEVCDRGHAPPDVEDILLMVLLTFVALTIVIAGILMGMRWHKRHRRRREREQPTVTTRSLSALPGTCNTLGGCGIFSNAKSGSVPNIVIWPPDDAENARVEEKSRSGSIPI